MYAGILRWTHTAPTLTNYFKGLYHWYHHRVKNFITWKMQESIKDKIDS